ncbi:MAG TPA: serine hydrolase [Acidimicrobiales bacterium]|nr:serine hydrolase [Acidimicrobiales bacterium]
MTAEAIAHGLIDALTEPDPSPLMVAVVAVEGGEMVEATTPEDAADLLFEVGSIAKTMTATLLADLVLDGTARLDDQVGTWLDAGDNADITLEQLALHTSGLPRLASNAFDWAGFTLSDPYAGYTAAHAEEALRAASREEVGTSAYSNFGYQLLGLALERASGVEFAELLRARLFEPLGMTGACVCGGSGRPRAQGHDSGRPVGHWSDLLAGAGGVDATATDMAVYLQAILSPPERAPGPAIRMALGPRIDTERGKVGLGWQISAAGLTWHNGGTGGFRSCLAVDRASGRGALVLANDTSLLHLDTAVMAAASGADPRDSRPAPAGPDWEALAREVGERIVAADWPAVEAAMSPATAEVLTRQRLAEAWAELIAERGEPTTWTVTRATVIKGRTTALITIDHTDASTDLSLTFDEQRRLVGILVS